MMSIAIGEIVVIFLSIVIIYFLIKFIKNKSKFRK